MNTRILVFYIPLILMLFSCTYKGNETRQPNFLIILSDDQAYKDFGFMGNDVVKTPHLDKLANEGAFYPNGYIPMSVCRPSLATFLTGLYPHQHGIHFNHPWPGHSNMKMKDKAFWLECRAAAEYLIRSVPTLPGVMAQNGYVCLQTGKHWEGDWRNAGFTHGMTENLPSPEPAYGNRPVASGEVVAHGNGDAGLNIGRDGLDPIYNFIKENADRPFMVWYAPFLPHGPFDSPEEFYEPYRNNENIPEYLVPYYACITRFDHTVGDLMDFLEKMGLDENTIVILMVDNGYRPDPGKANKAIGYTRMDDRSKLSQYENGVRTPVIIWWKDHITHSVQTRLVQTIDLVPTVLAAAGLEDAVPDLPGIDLMPSALGTEELPDRPAFGEIYPNDAMTLGHPSDHVKMRYVRYGDFKLIIPESKNYNGAMELYNLDEDSEELNNLAEKPEYEDKINELRNLVDDWWTPGDDSEVAKPARDTLPNKL